MKNPVNLSLLYLLLDLSARSGQRKRGKITYENQLVSVILKVVDGHFPLIFLTPQKVQHLYTNKYKMYTGL